MTSKIIYERVFQMFEITNKNEMIKVNDRAVRRIEGGFGENAPCVLVDDIASVHHMTTKALNDSIRKLIKKDFFTEGEDYIDYFKVDEKAARDLINISGSNKRIDLFIFSEKGYMKLITTLKNSKEKLRIVNEFVETYFNLREQVKTLADMDIDTYLDTLPQHMSPSSMTRYLKQTLTVNNIQDIIPKVISKVKSINLSTNHSKKSVTGTNKIELLTAVVNAVETMKNDPSLKVYDIAKIDDYNNQVREYRHLVNNKSNSGLILARNKYKNELDKTKELLEKAVEEKSIIEKPAINENNIYEDLLRSFKVYRNYLAKVWDESMEEVCNDYYDRIPVKLPTAKECNKLGYQSKFEYCYAYYPEDTKAMVHMMYKDCCYNGYLDKNK